MSIMVMPVPTSSIAYTTVRHLQMTVTQRVAVAAIVGGSDTCLLPSLPLLTLLSL